MDGNAQSGLTFYIRAIEHVADQSTPFHAMKNAVFLSLVALLTTSSSAQDFLLSEAFIGTCSGMLFDSGGPQSDYGNNESYTTVVCPNLPGGRIRLMFYTFNLSVAGTPDDALAIHDGNSTASPLLGTFTAQELENLVVSTSLQNPSGCLTLVFTSNSSGTGNIAAGITCDLPCQPPTASFTSAQGDTVLLCAGDTLTLDGSASQAAPGQTLAYWAWHRWGQAPVFTQVPVLQMAFEEPGVFHVQLMVVGGNSCQSLLTPPMVVMVSGMDSFLGTMATGPLCAPGTIDLLGHAVPVSFEANSIANGVAYGPGIALPDNVGQAFHSILEVNWGLPGAIISDASELGDICIRMEHSFMADLVVSLKCPNGQTAILHQQGGGATFLGDANDSNIPPGAGICWTYCFNANPDHGTWAQCAANGTTPNVIAASQGLALAPGSYTPVQPLTNLVGCPMNGPWTLTFTDLWAFDSGFLCSWGLDSTLDVDSFFVGLSPTLSLDQPDSAYWSGASVSNTEGPNAFAQLPNGGAHNFTFAIVDSYGCTYDTTLVIVSLQSPLVDAGADTELCLAPMALNGSASNGPPAACQYQLVLFDDTSAGWNGASVTCTINGVSTDYTSLSGFSTTFPIPLAQGDIIELHYSGTGSDFSNWVYLWNAQSQLLYSSGWAPPNGLLYSAMADCGVPPAVLTQWEPITGLADPSNPQTMVAPPAYGWYTLTATLQGGECAAYDSVWVSAANFAMLVWDEALGTLCCDVGGLPSYDWYLNGVYHSSTTTNCLADPPFGNWSVAADDGSDCTLISGPAVVCPLIFIEQTGNTISATPGIGNYQWTFNGNTIDGESDAEIPVQGFGVYMVVVSLPGCEVSATLDLTFMASIERSSSHELLIAPNPNNGDFLISLNSGLLLRIEVLDVAGRMPWKMTPSSPASHSVITTKLHAGAYLVRAYTTAGMRTAAFMVE